MNSPSFTAGTPYERHIPALDGIRGIAILAVLLHHARFLLNAGFHFQFRIMQLLNSGWAGVQLFFVLSGFLITGILVDSRGSPNYFTTFYVRRFLRIFPLYYAYLLLAFLGSPLLHRVLGVPDLLAAIKPSWYFTYTQNFRPNSAILDPYLGHLWSLAVEEQFYVVWPLLVLVLGRAALSWTCLILIPLSLAIRLHYAGQSYALSVFVNAFTPASLDSLAAGALVALAVRDSVWRPRAMFLARPIMLISLLWFCILAWRAGGLFVYEFLIHSWGITALTVFFAALIAVAATSRDGILVSILNLRGLRFTGRISYGLYVLHPIVMVLVISDLGVAAVPAPLDFALNFEKIILVLLASFASAALSWFYFERPVLQLKKYFVYR